MIAEHPPLPGPLRPLAWLALQFHLLLLGAISVAWNVAALLLYPLLPRAVGLRLGRAMIALGYGLFWHNVTATGMIHLRADALDALRDEPPRANMTCYTYP